MSSSFIQYQGHGFWSHDRITERLAGQAAAIAKARQGGDWLNELASHWESQSSGVFAGWMHLKLDEFVTDEARNAELQAIVSECISRHLEDDPVHQTGVLLILLLKGNVVWTASSPLDYMVGRNETEEQSNQ